MSENGWFTFCDSGIPIDPAVACDAQPEPTPIDKVKLAIMELAYKDQRKIYEFLYALGHRINQ